MLEKSIPLTMAIQGREYIINHINGGKTNYKNLHGYGIFPGSKIKPVFSSPSADPSAYEVMGAVLALRNEDSKHILVSPIPLLHQEELS